MQGYQVHATALAACCRLVPAYADEHKPHAVVCGAGPRAPGLPGHARRLRSYPPSRHRRRQ
jgi:hypothetical protein